MNKSKTRLKFFRFISGILFSLFIFQPGFTNTLTLKTPTRKKQSTTKTEKNLKNAKIPSIPIFFPKTTAAILPSLPPVPLNIRTPYSSLGSISLTSPAAVAPVASAQTNESNLPYWEWYPDDAVNLITSPSRWGALTWIRAAAMLGVGAGIYFHDTQIQSFFQRNRSGFTNDVASFATPFGEGAALPVLGILYWAHPNPKLGKTALLSLESFVIADAFTMGIKLIAHRARPYTGLPYNTFEGPSLSLNNDFLSFPSGHTTGAFAIASVIATEYRNVSYIPPLAYGMATLTGFARVNDNVHWASDVFVGGVIGYFTGKAITELHQNQDKNQSVLILPTAVQGSPGLLIGIHF